MSEDTRSAPRKRKITNNKSKIDDDMEKRTRSCPLASLSLNNSEVKQLSYNPLMLGDFSLSKDGCNKYLGEASIPLIKSNVTMPIDLNKGFDSWSDTFNIGNLDSLLHWICVNKFSLANINLITYRGLLKKIAITKVDPYRNHWCMRLSKVGSTVLMDEIETDQKKESKLSETHQQKKFVYYGHQFEESILNQIEKPVENNVVVTSKIGGTRCIFAAEVDGKFDNGQIVELKTHKVMQNSYHREDFRKNKLMNTFMQCFLVGIENAYFGFRDRHGFVHELKNYEISSIEDDCKKYWNRDTLLSMLSNILSWMIPFISDDKVYHMSFLGGDHINLEIVENVSYVPDWFTEYAKSPIHECDN